MGLSTERDEEGLSSEDRLLDHHIGSYVEPIKEVFAGTRVGTLLVEKHAITPSQLRNAMAIQKEEQKPLGEVLLAMGVSEERNIRDILRFQKTKRVRFIDGLVREELKLGRILIKGETITGKQLEEALEKQRKIRKPLGETLVALNIISRGTLETYLGIQQSLRKYVVISGLALLLVGSTSGMSVAQTSCSGISAKQKSFTRTDSIERKPCYRKGHVKKGRDHQGKHAAVASFESQRRLVRGYLRTAHGFRYELEKKGSDYWQLPEETERLGKGDCEDKAIWLYSKLLKDGFDNVRLVIGKEKNDSRIFHSWVAWYVAGKVYILDPTADSEMWEIQKYPKGYYKPYYSFYRDKSWRHS